MDAFWALVAPTDSALVALGCVRTPGRRALLRSTFCSFSPDASTAYSSNFTEMRTDVGRPFASSTQSDASTDLSIISLAMNFEPFR